MPDTSPPHSPPPVHDPGGAPTPMTAPPKPTGRRSLTAAQLAALDHPPPRPGGPSRHVVVAAFYRALPALGVPTLRDLMALLIGCSPSQDWLGEYRPMVWPSNEWLCARLGIKEGQLKKLIGLAFEHGLLAMRDSGNGHRRGLREKGEAGRILWAYGFDLSPLAARHDEFCRLAAAFEQREATVRGLKREISSTRRDVLTLVDLGLAKMPGVADWSDLACRTRQLAAQVRGQRDPDVLQMLRDQLRVMQDDVRALFEPDQDTGTAESDPSGSPDRPLNTPTSDSISLKSFAEAHGKAQPQPRTPEPATALLDPLCGFPASPAFVMMIAPQFRDFTTSSRPTRADIVSAAWHIREHIGISQDAWGEACIAFGRWEAAVAVAAITGRHNAGEVRSPGGLLRQMIKLYNANQLRLDRTLRGLAARLAGQQSQVPGKGVTIGHDTPAISSGRHASSVRGGRPGGQGHSVLP